MSNLDWELTVRTLPFPIEGGESFTASLDGVAVFSESFLDAGQLMIPGGFQRVTWFDFNATVHVRSGATGDDVILTVDPDLYEYQCVLSRVECDPAKDLPSVPGSRGNPDCDEPEGPTNPCGRSVPADKYRLRPGRRLRR